MLRRRRSGGADYSTLSSPSGRYTKPSASLFPSPRVSPCGLTGKGFSDPQVVMNPTSILVTNLSSTGGNTSSGVNLMKPSAEASGRPPHENRRRFWESGGLRGVGLAIVDALNDEGSESRSSRLHQRMVFLGSRLKIQIPPAPQSSCVESPRVPIEFGIKTKNLLLGSLSPSWSPKVEASAPPLLAGSLSMAERELSEDYTCVITRGPNPKTAHIFNGYVVESRGEGLPAQWRASSLLTNQPEDSSAGFLSICYFCKRGLGLGKETYIYRGDKSFCSMECRHQTMLFDAEVDDYSSKLARSP
ncbi:unnamed protein product [Spirodela intermedia]|uniref:FLZ-type domain-containing protein n=1 Tax=Spirodela intermedia TaxID=51605 RepID=A0A7I8KBF7_SPIIN|nr:unnamed protein product [Spirodela intermedia]